MIVDVVGVSVRGNQRLIATEVFSEAQTDLVSDLGGEIIVGTEGLYDVNVGPAVLFFELLFDEHELLKHRTVDRYISHMEDAFMLTRVKRYNVKGRKYIGTPYKIYFEDIGLRNARLNFRQIEGTHIMENIIYNELRYRGYQVDVGMVESRERDADGKEIRTQLEIDFIATLGSKKYYIQSAYAIPDQAKYEQETASFDKTMDSFKKIVVVEKSMKPRRDEKGYVMIGVKEFLLDKDSLEA